MSIPRLAFLYPHLFNTAKVQGPNISHHSVCSRQKRLQHSSFSTSPPPQQQTYAQRYGSAAEPQPPPIPALSPAHGTTTLAGKFAKEVESSGSTTQPQKSESDPAKENDKAAKRAAEKPPKPQSSPEKVSKPGDKTAGDSKDKENATTTLRENLIKPMETILQMETSDTAKPEEQKSPHLHAPLYVHHFDTYTLVKDLQNGGFTQDQSVTLMKAVRSLLALNLDIARQSLVSKSDIENVNLPFSLHHLYIID